MHSLAVFQLANFPTYASAAERRRGVIDVRQARNFQLALGLSSIEEATQFSRAEADREPPEYTSNDERSMSALVVLDTKIATSKSTLAVRRQSLSSMWRIALRDPQLILEQVTAVALRSRRWDLSCRVCAPEGRSAGLSLSHRCAWPTICSSTKTHSRASASVPTTFMPSFMLRRVDKGTPSWVRALAIVVHVTICSLLTSLLSLPPFGCWHLR